MLETIAFQPTSQQGEGGAEEEEELLPRDLTKLQYYNTLTSVSSAPRNKRNYISTAPPLLKIFFRYNPD